MTPEIKVVLCVLFAGFALAFYMLGHRVGKKQGTKEGQDKANKAMIARAKKHGFNMTEVYVKLIK